MHTLTLALALAAPALAQPAPTQPTPPPAAKAAEPAPLAAVTPEAQAVLDRAAAVYKDAKTYRESVLTTLRQKATGIKFQVEPPAVQSSTTTFAWAGPDRFSFDTAGYALYREAGQSIILDKGTHEYTQRTTTDDDRLLFANISDASPTFQALNKGRTGEAFGRVVTVTQVTPETVRGLKCKRLAGTGLPPIPLAPSPVPVVMHFADDTGLLIQATYDMKGFMQRQFDRARPGGAAADAPKITVEEFTITTEWTEAKLNPTDAPPPTFKPGASDKRVEAFSLTAPSTPAPTTAPPAPASEPKKP